MKKSDIMKAADRAEAMRDAITKHPEMKDNMDCSVLIEPFLAAAELLKQVEWQPIESAPKDGTRLLLKTKHFGIDIGSWKRDSNTGKKDWFNMWGDDFSTGSYYCPLSPTHWQPLPQPPVIIEKEGV